MGADRSDDRRSQSHRHVVWVRRRWGYLSAASLGLAALLLTPPSVALINASAHAASGSCGIYRDFWDTNGVYNPASPGGPTQKMAGDISHYFVSTPKVEFATGGFETYKLTVYTKPRQSNLYTCLLKVTFVGHQPYVRRNPPAKVVVRFSAAPRNGVFPEVKTLVEEGAQR